MTSNLDAKRAHTDARQASQADSNMNSRTITLILLTTVALAPFASALPWPAPAGIADPLPAGSPVTVTLVIDATGYTVPELAETLTCSVTVPADAKVANVLDQAALDGCISSWTWEVGVSSVTNGWGRFVTGLDGRQADCHTWPTFLVGYGYCTYYLYADDGSQPSVGVDLHPVTAGHTYTFTFTDGSVLPQ